MGSLYRRSDHGNWTAKYRDGSGRLIRRSTGTSRKQLAEKILQQWEAEALTIRAGIVRSSLETLIREWLEHLSRTSPKHRQHNEQRLRRVVDHYGWTKPDDIDRYHVEAAVRKLTDAKTDRPLSLRTQSHYLAACKAFTHWATHTRNAYARDPLASLRKPNFQRDRKRIRRYLTPEEWRWLRLTPNSLLYETAIQTGYRASELLHLTASSLKADHLYLPALHTKNREPARQYITADLAERLLGQLPFPVSDRQRLARLLRHDLAIARWLAQNDGHQMNDDFLQPTDSHGHILDFHSLRHTCGAWLAMQGVTPKTIQAVMRHSSITLTLDTYGHLMPGAIPDAVATLRRLLYT